MEGDSFAEDVKDELRKVEKDLNDLTLASGSARLGSSSSQDSLDESGKIKGLGSYNLKTAVRMLTDYINDLKISNISPDDSVQMRIEEYETLLREYSQREPDSSTLPPSQDITKLFSMLEDYHAVLTRVLDQTHGDPASQDVDDMGLSGVPVYITDTDFLQGGYMESLTAALNLCVKQVQEFVNLLPNVKIYRCVCTYLVQSLSSAAECKFERCRIILGLLHNQDFEGVQISSSLRDSVSFCFETLVGLARRFQLVVDLLRKCGSSEWYKSALELADVRPSRPKRWSEFSLAIRNCEWSLDLVELAFHALEKLLTEGTYTVKDATFKWSDKERRRVLQISGTKLERPNSSTLEKSLLEICRDLEDKDLTALIAELDQLVESERVKKYRFISLKFRGLSNAHGIAKSLSEKLKGPTPRIVPILPYSFSKIDPSTLKYILYLDKGSSGMVAKHSWYGMQVAVKSVRSPGLSRQKFEEEAAVLAMVQHPNVVRLIGCGFIEQDHIGLLVMELMDHDLRTIIDSRLEVLPKGSSPFAPIVAMDLMLQIAQAMQYLKEHRIVHRDLKAKNILVSICKPLKTSESLMGLDSANTRLMGLPVSAVLPHTQENYVAKLADFGLARCRPQTSYNTTLNVGTTGWRAPEVFNLHDAEVTQQYKWPADVYSYAMCCYEILTGKIPFENEPNYSLQAKIMAGERPPSGNLSAETVPEALIKLIEECWATDPEKRPDFENIVKRLWECKVLAILPGFELKIMQASGVTRVNSERSNN